MAEGTNPSYDRAAGQKIACSQVAMNGTTPVKLVSARATRRALYLAQSASADITIGTTGLLDTTGGLLCTLAKTPQLFSVAGEVWAVAGGANSNTISIMEVYD